MRNINALFEKVNSDLNKIQFAIDKEIAAQYLVALETTKADLLVIYEKYSIDGVLTHAEMSKYNRLTNFYNDLEAELGPILQNKDKIMKQALKIDYNEAFYRSEWMYDQHTGAAIKWGGLDKSLVKAAVKNPLNKISTPGALALDDKVFLSKLKNNITQGLVTGQGYVKTAKQIDILYGIRGPDGKLLSKEFRGEIYKSIRIMQTEGNRIRNQALKDQYAEARKEGVDEVDIWDATVDMSTRPEKGALDQTQRQPDGLFHGGGFSVSGPGQFGISGLDINCRCSIRPEVLGYKPRLRRVMKGVKINANGTLTYTKEVRPYETFKTWAERKGIKKNIYGQELKF